MSNEETLVIRGPQFEALKVGNPSCKWELDDGSVIYLLTLEELKRLQETSPMERLICIDGSSCSAMNCDDDIRFGYVAYGLRGVQ